MTPAQLAARLKKGQIAPAYLFLGTEAYERRRAKEALIEAVVGTDRENGISQYDLNEQSLAEVIDDARSLSLFATSRLIVVLNAEGALPRTRASAADGEEDGGSGTAEPLNDYLRDPSADVSLLFEATRFDFEGDDKQKLERVRKFYSAIADAVEFRRAAPDEARREAETLARGAGVVIVPAALDLLVEALGADLARIAIEIEKLALYAGKDRPVGIDEIAELVPDARTTTIFVLVNALGRRDRVRGLQMLDTLCREGEYLPLALSFLSTQFRLALVAREAGLKSPQQIQSHFARLGVPMWGSRAEQIYQTVAKFSKPQLERAMKLIYETDRGLRDARPDDRTVMERFVLELTAPAT
jgi:DNA polymerase III subunit delta